jgi:hypothetical protein
MNFPDEPIIRFLHWIINTPGMGGLAALLVGGSSITGYLLTVRWIRQGAKVDEWDEYTYPTPALLGHGHSSEE